MTKEQFIKQAGIIEDYIAAQRKAGKFLNDTFFTGSTASVFDFGDDLISLAIEQLSELSGIHRESIEWYIYEPGGTCKHVASGFSMNIQTSADLWDFETYESKKEHTDER